MFISFNTGELSLDNMKRRKDRRASQCLASWVDSTGGLKTHHLLQHQIELKGIEAA